MHGIVRRRGDLSFQRSVAIGAPEAASQRDDEAARGVERETTDRLASSSSCRDR
jgi:hypothetical protein